MAELRDGGAARVRSPLTHKEGYVVHRVIRNRNGLVARCKVHGEWKLIPSDDEVTCSTCIRKEQRHVKHG